MNLSPRWVAVLNDGGFQVAHWSDLGKPDAPDSQIMAYAHANDYVVLTHDLDFSAILAATQGEKPSVVQIRAGILSPAEIGEKMIAALAQMALELEKGPWLPWSRNERVCACCPCVGMDGIKCQGLFPVAMALRGTTYFLGLNVDANAGGPLPLFF